MANKNRLPPFVPLLVATLDAPAWKALSHGAKALYVALKRRVPRGRNQAYLSFRQAKAELGSRQDSISEWFRELRHYGFIVLASPGYLGVEGRGRAPHWRLTELGTTSKASAAGLLEPPTNDFLKWAGSPFKKTKPRTRRWVHPVPDGGYSPVPPVGTPKSESVPNGECIQHDNTVPDGGHITNLPLLEDSADADLPALPAFLDRRDPRSKHCHYGGQERPVAIYECECDYHDEKGD